MKTQHCTDTILLRAPENRLALPPWCVQSWRRVSLWMERRRQRQQLARLNEAMLKDIGLTRADVTKEIDKPFWRS